MYLWSPSTPFTPLVVGFSWRNPKMLKYLAHCPRPRKPTKVLLSSGHPSVTVLSPLATPLLRNSLWILERQSSCLQTGNSPACSWHNLSEQTSGGYEEMVLCC